MPIATASYKITWEKLPADFLLPNDPVDNIDQPALAAALTDSLEKAGRLQENVLVSTNYGVCTTLDGKIVVKAPDWMYVPQIVVSQDEIRRSYTPQLQGGIPAVVMEFSQKQKEANIQLSQLIRLVNGFFMSKSCKCRNMQFLIYNKAY
jgi:hypothetical protein